MSGTDATHRAAAVAAGQHGRITTAQLHTCGFDEDQIEHRTRVGLLHREHVGVYAWGHPGVTRDARWMSAQLALGEQSALSHRAAGAIWRIHPSDVLDVTIPSTRGCPPRDGIVPHRSPLPASDVCTIRGLRVTTLLRTLLDLAAVLTLRELQAAFEQAQVVHRLQPRALGARVILRGGFRGNAKLRTILVDAVDPGLVRSTLELHFFKLCRDFGIARPLTNVDIGPWNVDFVWPEVRVVVETDSKRWHSTAWSRTRDARKTEWLEAHGYVVIRLRWADVHARPCETAAAIHGAVSGV